MTMTLRKLPSTPAEKALAQELAQVEAEIADTPLGKRAKRLRTALDALLVITTPSKSSPAPWSYSMIAIAAIDEANKPLSTKEILDWANTNEHPIGGANPATNLSNTLSAHASIKSLEWNGGRRWWNTLRGNPPKEPKE
jgi:hypothetical protein